MSIVLFNFSKEVIRYTIFNNLINSFPKLMMIIILSEAVNEEKKKLKKDREDKKRKERKISCKLCGIYDSGIHIQHLQK